MLKVASNNQCLDAYKDNADGKFKVHTYACDVTNSNQKWNFNPSTKTLEHATHAGQCLDADPTYADRHAQMWACTPNNVNQQWSIDAFSS
ncbi:cytolethal distending toxin A/C family protein [Saprolegnia diclina VS20]|uniref:Cytolethal distending toxin A/C family protein n=1 Tax=Saprolegnia diclina (strain VS20) TaxID=1156394 RepID=T0QBP3_SAPDV|nr:cytolethal distending toxin A/C family protein [Saprolegnia diclina VS20]EQC30945.1 cytolethal distending toxin A/C family protein [Saprolegnia diclina VS20]|eukprot:XP_008615683.1 cytolethal distending toxin A/C family protein [Saprolegnia diclina VS20]